MPADFIGKPEKVHRAIEAKNELESVLADEPEADVKVVEGELKADEETAKALESLQL